MWRLYYIKLLALVVIQRMQSLNTSQIVNLVFLNIAQSVLKWQEIGTLRNLDLQRF